MAMENASGCHTTADEEEGAVAMNWQSGDSEPIIADPMRTPKMNSVTYYRRGGSKRFR
jgi:hypothetical protein